MDVKATSRLIAKPQNTTPKGKVCKAVPAAETSSEAAADGDLSQMPPAQQRFQHAVKF